MESHRFYCHSQVVDKYEIFYFLRLQKRVVIPAPSSRGISEVVIFLGRLSRRGEAQARKSSENFRTLLPLHHLGRLGRRPCCNWEGANKARRRRLETPSFQFPSRTTPTILSAFLMRVAAFRRPANIRYLAARHPHAATGFPLNLIGASRKAEIFDESSISWFFPEFKFFFQLGLKLENI